MQREQEASEGSSQEAQPPEFQPLTESDLSYFELARRLRPETQSKDAEFQALIKRGKALVSRFSPIVQAAQQSLLALRPDLQLTPPTLSANRLSTIFSFTLTREKSAPTRDAQIYFSFREEGLEIGFGFGMRNTRSHQAIRETFLQRVQRHSRKASRYLQSLLQRDYRLWPSPHQSFSTPTMAAEEWTQKGGAIVRLLDRSILIARQQSLLGIVSQIAGELVGMYGFLDRVYTDLPVIRPLHIESPEELADAPAEYDDDDAQEAASELLLDFLAYARSRQLSFPPSLVRTYILSLQTRPFVILSGVAGTGKSKLASTFAQFLMEDANTPQGNPHVAFLPVRPDWLDPHALLGYFDTIAHVYRPTPFLLLLLRAHQDPQTPYFAILDELNLARVEYYLADLLSLLESREYDQDGHIVSQASLHLHAQPEPLTLFDPFVDVVSLPGALPIPPNLYITGTVNLDETTHRLSPKVLDRVNLIEVKSPSPAAFLESFAEMPPTAPHRSHASIAHQRTAFIRHQLYTAPYTPYQLTLSPEFFAQLSAILDCFYQLLQAAGFPFGLRIVQEILDFAENSERLHRNEMDSYAWVLDMQLMQKILPRLHGPRTRLEPLLSQLLQLCWPHRNDPSFRQKLKQQLPDPQTTETHRLRALSQTPQSPTQRELPPPDLPHSAQKIAQMLTVLHTEPYTDFFG